MYGSYNIPYRTCHIGIRLLEYFVQEFGSVASPRFAVAQVNTNVMLFGYKTQRYSIDMLYYNHCFLLSLIYLWFFVVVSMIFLHALILLKAQFCRKSCSLLPLLLLCASQRPVSLVGYCIYSYCNGHKIK